MAKTLGLDRLPWTPVLGFGHLDSQHSLSKLWEGVVGLLLALSLNPKQLTLGTHAAHGVPQGNQTEPHSTPNVFCFAFAVVNGQQHWRESSGVLIGTTAKETRRWALLPWRRLNPLSLLPWALESLQPHTAPHCSTFHFCLSWLP